MSKFQIVKGITDNLSETPYTEGKVYFVYDNAESQNITIYADIDDVRRKIKEGVQRDELDDYLLKTDIADWAKEATKPTYTANEVGALSTSHPAATITTNQITQWNNKSDFSGSYNDLTGKPTIPTKTSELTNDSGYVENTYVADLDNPSVNIYNEIIAAYNAGRNIIGKYKNGEILLPLIGIDITSSPSNVQFGLEVNQQSFLLELSSDGTLETNNNGFIIPTKTSELTNDSGFLTEETDPTVPAWAKEATKPTYTAAEVGATTISEVNSAIATAIGNINQFNVAIVSTLPTENIDDHTIYFMSNGGSDDSIYDEWMYINNNWEKIGTTAVDLSGYMQTSHPANGITSTNINNWNAKVEKSQLRVGYVSGDTLYAPGGVSYRITGESEYTGVFYFVIPSTSASDVLRANTTISQVYLISNNRIGITNKTFTEPGLYIGYISDNILRAKKIATVNDIPTVPTKVSDLTNDSGFISSYTETDPVFSASVAANITSTDISNWNAKSNTDEKVKTEEYSTADSTGHPIVLGKTSAASITESKYATTNLTFYINDSNYYTLKVGSQGRAKGRIWINSGDGNTSNGTYLITSARSNRIVTLPDKAGTLALTSDIPDTSSFVSNITYDATNRELKQTINGTTSTIVDFGTAAFKLVTTTISSNSSNLPTAGAVIEYVDNKIPKIYSSTNTTGYLTMDTLPIYDGTVV